MQCFSAGWTRIADLDMLRKCDSLAEACLVHDIEIDRPPVTRLKNKYWSWCLHRDKGVERHELVFYSQ
jgi:hypothetical protein